MKRIMNLVMAATIICGACVFTACTNVDDPIEPQPVKKQYRLIRLCYTNEAKSRGTASYTYDSQGRIVSEEREETNSQGIRFISGYYYIYGSHRITSVSLAGDIIKHFTLNDDGLIVKEEFMLVGQDEKPRIISEYQYDAEGRVVSYDNRGQRTYCIWEDGDIRAVMTGEPGSLITTAEFTPSTQSVEQGFIFPYISTFEEVLYWEGYYGKTPKHLIAKVESHLHESETMYSDLAYDYTYTVADGHITEYTEEGDLKIVIGGREIGGPRKATYTLDWE